MKRKLLAAACAVLALGLLLAACGNKYLMIESDRGLEYPAVTDEAGNTVVNDEGDLLVYVTDANGEVMTDANGDPQTNSIDFPKVITDGKTLETADFKLTVPDGWTVDKNGVLLRESGEDAKETIDITNFGALDEGETVDGYMQEKTNGTKALEQMLLQSGNEAQCSSETITLLGQSALRLDLNAKMQDGRTAQYVILYYFYNDEAYKILYTAENIAQPADVVALIEQNMTMK